LYLLKNEITVRRKVIVRVIGWCGCGGEKVVVRVFSSLVSIIISYDDTETHNVTPLDSFKASMSHCSVILSLFPHSNPSGSIEHGWVL
jgi:hypothetical protein